MAGFVMAGWRSPTVVPLDGGDPTAGGIEPDRCPEGIPGRISHGRGITPGPQPGAERILPFRTEGFLLLGGKTPLEYYFSDKDSRGFLLM